MSEHTGWRKKLQRIKAVAQIAAVPMFGPSASPPPQPLVPPPTRPSYTRPAEVQPQARVPESVRQFKEHDKRQKQELRDRAMNDAASRPQTTSQLVDRGTAADAREKRRQRAGETASGAQPAPVARKESAPERKRSGPSR